MCAPGFGIPDSKLASSDVSLCELCPFGTYHAGGGLSCTACPRTPFNHPVGDKYVSYGITFAKGLTGPETCVPRYAQLPAPAGHRLAINESLFQVSTTDSFVPCIEGCPVDQLCITQWELQGTKCKRAILPPAGPEATSARLYYKLPPSEIIAAASANDTKVVRKTQAAGVYARGLMNPEWVTLAELGLVGTSTNPSLVEVTDMAQTVEWGECENEMTCRLKCETTAACWGFINVPGKGWATRGGEDQIGTRSFVVSPDFSQPAPDIGEGGSVTPATCPAGHGGLFDCTALCAENTWNDGTMFYCESEWKVF